MAEDDSVRLMLRPSCPCGGVLPTPHNGIVRNSAHLAVVVAFVKRRAEIVALEVGVDVLDQEWLVQGSSHALLSNG